MPQIDVPKVLQIMVKNNAADVFLYTGAKISMKTPKGFAQLGEPLEAGDAEAFFAAVEPVSVDVGVMERSGRVEVVLAGFGWDDVGSWSALARTREPDSQGNVRVGAAHAVDARNNIAWADDGEIVLFGVDNLVVVRSGGVTLVTRRDSAPDLKKLVTRLRGGE